VFVLIFCNLKIGGYMAGLNHVHVSTHKHRREQARKVAKQSIIATQKKRITVPIQKENITSAASPFKEMSSHNRIGSDEISAEIKIPKSPQATDQHHRLAKSRGGDFSNSNIIIVPISKHRAFHTLHGNNLPPEIADELNENWIDRNSGWLMIAIQTKQIETKNNVCNIYYLSWH